MKLFAASGKYYQMARKRYYRIGIPVRSREAVSSCFVLFPLQVSNFIQRRRTSLSLNGWSKKIGKTWNRKVVQASYEFVNGLAEVMNIAVR